MRLLTPAPQAPLLPPAVVAYGSARDARLEFQEYLMSPVLDALHADLDAGARPGVIRRLRTFRYAWPRDRIVSVGIVPEREAPTTLFGDVVARAKAAGWKLVASRQYFVGSTLSFAKRGRVFGIAIGNPKTYESFEGGGRRIVVPVIGEPRTTGDVRMGRYVPLFVVTDVFDPEGASYPKSVVAPFLDPRSKVRMRLADSNEIVETDRKAFEAACLGRGPTTRRYAPCVGRYD